MMSWMNIHERPVSGITARADADSVRPGEPVSVVKKSI
jgi:hypothetical protein